QQPAAGGGGAGHQPHGPVQEAPQVWPDADGVARRGPSAPVFSRGAACPRPCHFPDPRPAPPLKTPARRRGGAGCPRKRPRSFPPPLKPLNAKKLTLPVARSGLVNYGWFVSGRTLSDSHPGAEALPRPPILLSVLSVVGVPPGTGLPARPPRRLPRAALARSARDGPGLPVSR